LARRAQPGKPTIDQICVECGTPGLAIEIFGPCGEVLDNYHGYRDIGKKIVPDTDTIFSLEFMCKGFTALAVGCLVDNGKVSWDDCIGKLIQGLRGTLNGNSQSETR